MTQLSNSNCKKEVDCKDNEMCKTDIAGFFNIISKGCDASCETAYQDFSVGNRNISCCDTNFCNVNAAGSLRSSYGIAAGIAASLLWPFLNNRL
uniref:Snake toxin/toxin-like domain-containing protein n=1 Tax=Calidris pygmaea TaxID=425635 RepID=A0A8C3JMR5_9CHAR